MACRFFGDEVWRLAFRFGLRLGGRLSEVVNFGMYVIMELLLERKKSKGL